MKNYTQRRLEVGDNVVICDSINTGLIGTVGGYKGTSVAVCMKENTGHDCEGLCPSGGTYESEYALLPFKEEDRKSLGLLLNHIHKPSSITQALAEERERMRGSVNKTLDRYVVKKEPLCEQNSLILLIRTYLLSSLPLPDNKKCCGRLPNGESWGHSGACDLLDNKE